MAASRGFTPPIRVRAPSNPKTSPIWGPFRQNEFGASARECWWIGTRTTTDIPPESAKRKKSYRIHFEDKDKQWSKAASIAENALKKGDRIFVIKQGQERYLPTTILFREEGRIQVHFEEGRREYTSLVRIRDRIWDRDRR